MLALCNALLLVAFGLLPGPIALQEPAGHETQGRDLVIVRFFFGPSATAAEMFEARFIVQHYDKIASDWHIYTVLDGAPLDDKRSWILADPLVCSAELWPPGMSEVDVGHFLERQSACPEPDTARLARINHDYAGSVPEARPIASRADAPLFIAAFAALAGLGAMAWIARWRVLRGAARLRDK